MSLFSTRRVFSLLLLGLLSLLWGVRTLDAQSGRPATTLDLAGTWRTHAGDDLAWAAPGLDDSDWKSVSLPSTWQEQGYSGLEGRVWYRRTVALPEGLEELARDGDLGALLGPPIFGAVEIWIDGRPAGRTRGWDLDLPVPRETAIALPAITRLATAETGAPARWTLALRVRSVGWASARSPVAGPVMGRLALGSYATLAEGVGYRWSQSLLTDLPLLLLAVVIGVGALYHLLLFLRRRQEVHYLWFGLLALAFSVNTLTMSWWIYELTDRRDLVLRLGDLSGHLAAALAIQFLWPFFGRPIGRWLRVYQLSHVLIAVTLGLWPHPALVLDTVTVRWLWLLPLLAAAAWLVFRELRPPRQRPAPAEPAASLRSHELEARWIAAGGAVLVMTEAHQLVAESLGVGELPVSLVPFGFAAVLVSMALALAHRFRHLLEELEGLRHELEGKVRRRTRELQRQNEELLRSQRRARQVFSTLADVMEGRVLDGRYRLEKRIGSGGNAAVYRGRDLESERPVAVKILQPAFAEDDLEKTLERFRREGVTACRVDHPNAVSVLGSGISATGIAYLVMELLEGHDLGWEIRHRAPLEPRRCVEIALAVCDVLATAETAGVVHRDIKPGNVFLHRAEGHEMVKVVDFGIAKLLGGAPSLEGLDSAELPLTRTGHLLGTPPYLAPERLRGEPGDVKADIYSVGLMLYEMLSGRLLFRRKSGGIDYQRLFRLEPPEPLAQVVPEVPEELARIVGSALAAEPRERPGPKELAGELASFLDKKIPGESPAGDHMGSPPGCLGTTPLAM